MTIALILIAEDAVRASFNERTLVRECAEPDLPRIFKELLDLLLNFFTCQKIVQFSHFFREISGGKPSVTYLGKNPIRELLVNISS